MRRLTVYPEAPKLAVDGVEALDTDVGCERCKLFDRVRTVCMSPEIYGDPNEGTLLVVSPYPGETEDRHSRPNVGANGMYLRDQLASRWGGAVVFDSAVRCAPGANKVITSMVDACRPYLAGTIEEAKPDRIICLGSTAISAVVGRGFPPMSVRKGYAYLGDVPVLFLLHHGGSMRNRILRGWFEEDLDWAVGCTPPKPPLDAMCLIVENAQDAEDAVEDLRLAESVTWDIETYGAPFNSEYDILNLALTPEDGDYAYVLEKGALDDPDVGGVVRAYLGEACSGGQNIKFDVVGMRAKYGLKVPNVVFDTMLWKRILDADQYAKLENQQTNVGMAGSKDEAGEYVAAGVKELRKMVRQPDTQPVLFNLPADQLVAGLKRINLGDRPQRYAYAAIPGDIRSVYNAKDTISTERVRSFLSNRMDGRPDLKRVWDEVVSEMNYGITEMEINGIAVSRDAVRQLQVAMGTRIADIKTRLLQYGADFNPNSPKQVAELLYDKLGLPAPRNGRGTGAGVLAALEHPVATDIIAFRKATKFKGQYADGMEFFIRDDGRIHPNYQIAGTATGRPSCTDPNLFNIPNAATAEGKMCRDIFVAADGCTLMEFDYSQIELRVAAMLSGDDVMIDFFKQGADFHLQTAKLIAGSFNIDPDDVTAGHPLRQQAKIVNFATLYGDPPAGLAARLNISRRMAESLQKAILGKFRRLRSWINDSLKSSRRSGVSRTWWNGDVFRERPLWKIADGEGAARETAERSSWNTPVQGTAAEYTNASIGAIQRWLDDDFVPAKMVLTVYDSILLEVQHGAVDEVRHGVKNIMEGWPVLHDVPIVSDLKIGPAWGSMEEK